MAVKSDPLRWGRCRVQESSDLERDSLRHGGPWTKRCHAGLLELVVPVCKRRSKISPRNRSGEPVVAETNQAITLRIELRGAVIPVVG
jgi:hypothetical protein